MERWFWGDDRRNIERARVELSRDGSAKIQIEADRTYTYEGRWRQSAARSISLRLDGTSAGVFNAPNQRRQDDDDDSLGNGEITLDGASFQKIKLRGRLGERDFQANFEVGNKGGGGWIRDRWQDLHGDKRDNDKRDDNKRDDNKRDDNGRDNDKRDDKNTGGNWNGGRGDNWNADGPHDQTQFKNPKPQAESEARINVSQDVQSTLARGRAPRGGFRASACNFLLAIAPRSRSKASARPII